MEGRVVPYTGQYILRSLLHQSWKLAETIYSSMGLPREINLTTITPRMDDLAWSYILFLIRIKTKQSAALSKVLSPILTKGFSVSLHIIFEYQNKRFPCQLTVADKTRLTLKSSSSLHCMRGPRAQMAYAATSMSRKDGGEVNTLSHSMSHSSLVSTSENTVSSRGHA